MANNILVIQTAFLGDLVLTTPFVFALRERYPKSRITILVNAGTESILANNPSLDSILVLDKKKAKRGFLYFIRFLLEIRRHNFDLVYSPHFSFRSSLIAFFTGAKTRIGYQESGLSFLHTKRIHRPRTGLHEVDKLFSLLDGVHSSEIKGRERQPFLYPSSSVQESVKAELKSNSLIEGDYIVIAPSSLWETKRMPEDKFAELIVRFLKETNFKLVLIGSKADEPIADKILQIVKSSVAIQNRITNLTGKTSLSEVIVWIQFAKLLISNDSSPIHFASAFNVPTLMIYGATVPDFGYSTLASKQRISEVLGLDCRPCGIHGGRICPKSHFKCMKDQNVSQMFEMAKELLE